MAGLMEQNRKGRRTSGQLCIYYSKKCPKSPACMASADRKEGQGQKGPAPLRPEAGLCYNEAEKPPPRLRPGGTAILCRRNKEDGQ